MAIAAAASLPWVQVVQETKNTSSRGVCVLTQSCPHTLRFHRLWPARLLCPWDSPGKNTGAGCYCLLQGIFLTQSLNPGLLHRRQILLTSESPGIPEVAHANTLGLSPPWSRGPTGQTSTPPRPTNPAQNRK